MRRHHRADALFDVLSDATKKDELTAIDGIGETLAAILQGATFTNAFRALRGHITPTVYEPPAESGEKSATGKTLTFVITGKLSRPRDEIKAELEAKGHKVTGSVTKNTDYLLCESKDSQSTKAKKARELGTQVIGEEELAGILEKG
jgi:DNA ligase (NAD+)